MQPIEKLFTEIHWDRSDKSRKETCLFYLPKEEQPFYLEEMNATFRYRLVDEFLNSPRFASYKRLGALIASPGFYLVVPISRVGEAVLLGMKEFLVSDERLSSAYFPHFIKSQEEEKELYWQVPKFETFSFVKKADYTKKELNIWFGA